MNSFAEVCAILEAKLVMISYSYDDLLLSLILMMISDYSLH